MEYSLQELTGVQRVIAAFTIPRLVFAQFSHNETYFNTKTTVDPTLT
jgi:hypothetical protein